MPQGLPVSRLVSVTVNLSPSQAQALNFDTLLVMGDSDVIDTVTRIRSFGSLAEVATAFGIDAPEYAAAVLFFEQAPQPTQLYIGRWASGATHGELIGGAVSAANQLVGAWTPINNGAFDISIDGVGPQEIGGLNFAAVDNLNAVAAIIQAGIPGGSATCAWDSVAQRFTITSTTTGAASAISFATAPGAGTDISGMLEMLAASSGAFVANGIVAETPAQAVTIMDNLPTQWYGLMFASTVAVTDDQSVAVAALVEADGVNNPHVFGISTSEGAAVVSPDTTSIGYRLKQLGYNRSFAQWSSLTEFAAASFFGRAFTVDFLANASTITLMYKQEPGVQPEMLTTAQADALDSQNYNYFAQFNNDTAIIVNGKMASGQFFDTVWGIDWLANLVKTNLFNLLYGANKIPQTNNGMGILASGADAACAQAVANGLVAPGVWNAQGFGQLKQGGYLDKGYYIYFTPVDLQSESDRQARRGTPIQIAVKLAGAVQTVNVAINVNQ